MAVPALSHRASVRLPWPRFQSPLTEPGVPISGTGLSSGIMRLAHGPPGQGRDRAGDPANRGRCTSAILPPASSPMRRRACSRLDDIEPIGSDSFASACDALRALRHEPGVLGSATPAGVRPSRVPPHLRPLPSTGMTRLPRYCGPLRHPAGLACPSRSSGWRVPRHRQGFPCCHHPPLPCVPPSLPRRSRPVRASLASRPVAAFPVIRAGRPPHRPFRGLLDVHCALRPAWSLSRPGRPVASKCFSRSRYLLQPLRLLPAGATVAGRVLKPAEGQLLSTAHRISQARHYLLRIPKGT